MAGTGTNVLAQIMVHQSPYADIAQVPSGLCRRTNARAPPPWELLLYSGWHAAQRTRPGMGPCRANGAHVVGMAKLPPPPKTRCMAKYNHTGPPR